MASIELKAARVAIDQSGAVGAKVVLPLDDNLYVTSVNMKATAYTIAAQPKYPCRVTAKTTSVGAADTLGNLKITGTLADDTVCTEEVTLTAATTVSSVNEFKTLTELITPGWVIDAGSGNDTIIIGSGATICGGQYFMADVDKIVTSTNMIVGAYTVAAQPQYPTTITVTATAGDTADTMGTVTISGFGVDDAPISETVTPVAGSTVTTTAIFKTILSVVGAGWVIDGEEGTNDTITVGVSAVAVAADRYISALHVVAAAAVAAQTNITGATNADFTEFTSLPVGVYPCKLSAVSLTSGEAIAYLAKI